jgi:T-complex protein 1 subunit theta
MGLLKEGFKHLSGLEEAILRNTQACKELSQMTRTSLGPHGLNKLIINHLNKVFVTSDTNTIVTELEIAHPAANMVVMAAKMQQQEVGDGSNFVVTFAGELLSLAEGLLRMGVHPSDIVLGYTKASKYVYSALEELTARTIVDLRNEQELALGVKTAIAAKQYGYEDLIGSLVSRACLQVMPAEGRMGIPVDNVRVAKLMGGTIADSTVLPGMVCMRRVEGSVTHVTDAKIAVFGCSVSAAETETKATVLITNAEEMMSYNRSEEEQMEAQIKAIADSGVKVVISGGSISEIAMHFIERHGMMAIKIMSKFELRRLCRATGATAVIRLGALMPEELGYCDDVAMQHIGGRKVVVFRNTGESKIATIILRGSTQNSIDDLERAVDCGVNTAKQLVKDGRLLPGGGATEIELATRVNRLADSTPGLDQYAIRKFAEALEVVPRILSENAGLNATETISALYSAHAEGNVNAGVNVEDGGTCDVAEANIFDTFASKHSAFRLACDSAITVLRVDQIIMAKEAGGPKAPKQ